MISWPRKRLFPEIRHAMLKKKEPKKKKGFCAGAYFHCLHGKSLEVFFFSFDLEESVAADLGHGEGERKKKKKPTLSFSLLCLK